MARLIVRLAVTMRMVSPFHLKATAQSSAADAATGLNTETQSSKSEDALDEIIVTAQRREEILSKTPVSVQAFTSEELAQANIVSEDDLQTITPGLEVRSQRNGDELNYSLRGQSQDMFTGTPPGVLPYFNEVQIAGQLFASAREWSNPGALQFLWWQFELAIGGGFGKTRIGFYDMHGRLKSSADRRVGPYR
jgi:outer membrane receptor protein involved in Fe transport